MYITQSQMIERINERLSAAKGAKAKREVFVDSFVWLLDVLNGKDILTDDELKYIIGDTMPTKDIVAEFENACKDMVAKNKLDPIVRDDVEEEYARAKDALIEYIADLEARK